MTYEGNVRRIDAAKKRLAWPTAGLEPVEGRARGTTRSPRACVHRTL